MGRRKGMLAGWRPRTCSARSWPRSSSGPGSSRARSTTSSSDASTRWASRRSTSVAAPPRRLPGDGAGDHHRPPVRQLAAGVLRRPAGVMAGAYDIVIAAGVESMTRVPMWANTPTFGRLRAPLPGAIRPPADLLIDQGLSGAGRRAVGARARLDEFALASHRRGPPRRRRAGSPTRSPVRAERDGEEWLATADEGIRPDTSLEALAALRPVFREDGRLTAGNSSQISDSAAALLIVSESAASRLGLRPRARFHSFALAGVDPIEASPGRSRARARCSPGPASRWPTSTSSR